jgi:cell division protein FtsX
MWPKILKKLSDLPLSKGDYGVFIPWVIAAMVFFASLALHVSFQIHNLVKDWEKGLNHAITVQVTLTDFQEPLTASSFEEKLEKKAQEVLLFLAKHPEIKKTKIIDKQDMMHMMSPWFGKDQIISKEFMPILIKINPAPSLDSIKLSYLSKQLNAQFKGVTLDFQNLWLKSLVGLGKTIQKISFFILAIVFLITTMMIVFLIKTGFMLHKKHVEMLSLMGASSSYIRKQFMRYVLFRGLQGIFYAAIALVLFFTQGFGLLTPYLGSLSTLITFKEISMLGCIFMGMIVLIGITSYLTLQNNIQRLP